MLKLYSASVLITVLIFMTTSADAAANRLLTRHTKVRVIAAGVLIAAAALGEWVGLITNGGPASTIWPHRIAKVVEFSCAPAIGLVAAFAYGQAIKPKLAISLVAAHGAFEWVAMFYGWVFLVDEQNLYHRQALYGVYVAAFVLSVIYCCVGIVRNDKAYQFRVDSVLVLILFMLALGIGIQFVFSSIRIDYLCVAICNMMLYIRFYKIILQVDAVTRLLNRRCYDVSISDLDTQAAILFFDVDKFKQVNDTYGHSVGDLCLKNVAQRLREVYGKDGTCYRVGGDEFCVILHRGLDRMEELNRRFEEEITSLQATDHRMPHVSVGYALYRGADFHIRDAIEEADAMLYRSKHGAASQADRASEKEGG
ncbi:MAG: GGDEF domain-containing protein [Faecousia sp.]